jgi:hypothetical protein
MKFPKTIFVSIAGSGEDEYLSACDTEESAIKSTDNGETGTVAEYELVTTRKRRIAVSVVDAPK